MEKKYDNYLGELEELIDRNILSEKHPYYNLYKYIIEKNKEQIIKINIRNYLISEIDKIKQFFFNEIKEDDVKLDLTMLPWLNDAYQKVLLKDYSQIQAIITLLQPETLKKFIDGIYDECTSQSEIKKNKITIEKTIKKITEECCMSLKGLKYQNQQFIIKQDSKEKINTDIIVKFLKELNENDILAINILQKEEEKRRKITIECNKINDIIENSNQIINEYICKKIDKRIKQIDQELFYKLKKEKKIYNYLLSENIIEYHNNRNTINITLDRLKELKIAGEIFENLNIRCRLLLIKDSINNDININISINNTEDLEILEEIIESKNLEEIEPRFVEITIKEIKDEFKTIKERQYNEKTEELANIMYNQEIYKTETLKQIENNSENNIYAIYMPTPQGTISRGNAIYIINAMKKMEEKPEQLDYFLTNPLVRILNSREKNIIKTKAKEKLVKYINYETQELCKNPNNQKQLKLTKKGEY